MSSSFLSPLSQEFRQRSPSKDADEEDEDERDLKLIKAMFFPEPCSQKVSFREQCSTCICNAYTNRTTCRSFSTCFIILPDSKTKTVWNGIVALLLFYTGTLFPYQLCFEEFAIGVQHDPSPGWKLFAIVIDVLFWADLVLNLVSFAYLDEEGNLVTSHRRIAVSYFQGFFLLDLLACLPPEAFQVFVPNDSSQTGSNKMLRIARLHRVSRISRLSRLMRIGRITKIGKIKKLIDFAKHHPVGRFMRKSRFLMVLKSLAGFFFCVHLFACGWYLVAALQDEEDSHWVARRGVGLDELEPLLNRPPFEQWVHSVYFVLTVFTTVGFGDIVANTPPEIVYVLVLQIAGAVIHSVIMGEVINTVTSETDVHTKMNSLSKLTNDFAEHADCSDRAKEHLKLSTTKHAAAVIHHAEKHSKEDAYDSLKMYHLMQHNALPRHVMDRLAEMVYRGRLSSNNLFHEEGIVEFLTKSKARLDSKESAFQLPLLVAVLGQSTTFTAKQMVYAKGDRSSSMFLILRGTCGMVAALPSSYQGPSSGPDQVPQIGIPKKMKDYVYQLRSYGSYFGAQEYIHPRLRLCSVRCESEETELLELKRNPTFEIISGEFPDFAERLKVAAMRHEQRRKELGRRHPIPGHMRLAATTIQCHFRGLLGRKRVFRQRSMSSKSPRSNHGLGAENMSVPRQISASSNSDLSPNARHTSVAHSQGPRKKTVTGDESSSSEKKAGTHHHSNHHLHHHSGYQKEEKLSEVVAALDEVMQSLERLEGKILERKSSQSSRS